MFTEQITLSCSEQVFQFMLKNRFISAFLPFPARLPCPVWLRSTGQWRGWLHRGWPDHRGQLDRLRLDDRTCRTDRTNGNVTRELRRAGQDIRNSLSRKWTVTVEMIMQRNTHKITDRKYRDYKGKCKVLKTSRQQRGEKNRTTKKRRKITNLSFLV